MQTSVILVACQQAFISFKQCRGQQINVPIVLVPQLAALLFPHSGKNVLKEHIGWLFELTVPKNRVTRLSHDGRQSFEHSEIDNGVVIVK